MSTVYGIRTQHGHFNGGFVLAELVFGNDLVHTGILTSRIGQSDFGVVRHVYDLYVPFRFHLIISNTILLKRSVRS